LKDFVAVSTLQLILIALQVAQMDSMLATGALMLAIRAS
jgi:hypothetical protein